MRVAIAPVLLVSVVALAGCKTADPQPPVVVYRQAPAPELPVECDERRDSKWLNLPTEDVRADVVIRNHAENKTRSGRIRNNRAVCGAALRANGLLR